MNKILSLFCLLIMATTALSQSNDARIVHSEKHNDMLYLYMKPDCYTKMSETEKRELVKSEANKNGVKLVNVFGVYKVELWRVNSNKATKIDMWDKNDIVQSDKGDNHGTIRSLKHPWFFNISGAISMKNHNIHDAFSPESTYCSGYVRIGCYLLKGRWDLAINNILSYSSTEETVIKEGMEKAEHKEEISFNGSFGVDTRVYFPIKSMKISPFVGVGLARSYGDGNKATTIPVSGGLCIMLKRGSVEGCYQYEKTTKGIFIIGYTFILK